MIGLVRRPLLALVALALTLWSKNGGAPVTINPVLSRYIHAAALWIFGVSFAIGCLNTVNKRLNDLAHNNWVWDPRKDPLMRFSAESTKWDWKDEIAVITGGADGIGAFTAKGLASHGVKVAVLDVQPPGDVLKDVQNISYFRCDVSNKSDVDDVAEAVRSTLGTPSILINNAGIARPYLILELPPGRVEDVLRVNLTSHFHTIQAFLPGMIERKKGHVMAVASIASFWSGARMSAYSCSKAAVLALHESLKQELKYKYRCPEIKTSIVHPHFTKTKLIAGFEDKLRKRVPPPPILEPQDVANAMVKQILSGRGGQIFLPESTGAIVPLVRGLPTWMQEFLRDAGTKSER